MNFNVRQAFCCGNLFPNSWQRMVVTPWGNILKYRWSILNILPSDPALLRCIALAERYLPSKARAGARFLVIEYFKSIVHKLYFKIFIFAQIPFNITFNNINWYWQNVICKANVSARNHIDSTKRKTKWIAKEKKTTKLGAQGQHLPVLCQICYWFHSGSTLEAPWTRFPGNEANFGPNLHILIAPLSQRSISNFSKLNKFANH